MPCLPATPLTWVTDHKAVLYPKFFDIDIGIPGLNLPEKTNMAKTGGPRVGLGRGGQAHSSWRGAQGLAHLIWTVPSGSACLFSAQHPLSLISFAVTVSKWTSHILSPSCSGNITGSQSPAASFYTSRFPTLVR
jgi:hypothetical protein